MPTPRRVRLPSAVRAVTPKQREILYSPSRFVVALCGRRVGKTHIGAMWTARRVHQRMLRIIPEVAAGKRKAWDGLGKSPVQAQYVKPDVYAWVVAPRTDHLDEIRGNFQRIYSGAGAQFLNPSFPSGFYDRGSQLWLYIGGVAAKIEFIPASSEARMAGKGLDVLWIDEAGFVSDRIYRVVRPATLDRKAEILASGTPDTGEHHWFVRMAAAGLPDDHEREPRNIAERDERIHTIIADTRFDAAEPDAREEALKLEKEWGESNTRQLFAADWRIPSQMVYDEWNPSKHILDYDPATRMVGDAYLPPPDHVVGSIDWSYSSARDGAAIVVHYWRKNPLHKDSDRPLLIVVEDAQEKLPYTNDGWYGILSAMAMRHAPKLWYSDPHSPEMIKGCNTAQMRFPAEQRWGKVVAADARDKGGRINMIRGMMHWTDEIEPALYLSKRGCSHLPRQFAIYKYKRDATTGDITDKTIDHDDHCLDALAFLIGKLFGAVTTLRIGGPLF